MTRGGASGGPGLLLVESVAIGRFTLQREFPLVHAAVKRSGLPSTWLRFGLDASVQYTRGEEGIGLDDADLATLLERIASERPSDVLLSQQPAESLRARLLGTGVRLHVSTADALDALGVAHPDGSGDEAADFGFLPANEGARRVGALAFLPAGDDCHYARRVDLNPRYEAVDLTGCRTTGCAFCVTGGTGRAGAVPAGRVLGLIRAATATMPIAPGERARLRIPAGGALSGVLAIARGLREGGGPAVDLLFDSRADLLLATAADLVAAAAALAGTGHRIHVCLVGVENFSRPELERMNKGVAPWQNLAAIRTLRALEREHPSTFSFSEHRGLSTILFTPWTRLDDLAVNLSIARRLRLGGILGKLLRSRLRLEEGLPMTALARRDGLLIPAYEDPLLDTARRNFYSPELPWRFGHPEVEAVSRLLIRLDPDPAIEADPLCRRVQAWRSGRDPIAAAAELVDRAFARPGADAEALLEEASTAAARPSTSVVSFATPRAEPGHRGPRTAADGHYFELQAAGLNRVNRLEAVEAAEAERVAQRARDEGRCCEVVPLAGERGRCDVFFGATAEEVREAVVLTQALRESQDPQRIARARMRIGELYGYPRCCADAYASVTSPLDARDEWLHVLRRAEIPGSISEWLEPMSPALPYVPCAYDCAASMARAQRGAQAVRSSPPGSAPTGPLLILLDRPGQSRRLLPVGAVGASFDFVAGPQQGDDPRLAALAPGGRIRVDEGAITVERDGARVASFWLSAFLFWSERTFDPEFWKEAAAQALALRGEEEETRAAREDAAPPRAPPEPALVARVRALLTRREPDSFGGYGLRGVEPADDAVRVTLGLSPPGEPLELFVETRRGGRRYFCVSGDLGIQWSNRTPVRTSAQVEAVRMVAAALGGPPARR